MFPFLQPKPTPTHDEIEAARRSQTLAFKAYRKRRRETLSPIASMCAATDRDELANINDAKETPEDAPLSASDLEEIHRRRFYKRLNILSQNIWGVPGISPCLPERVESIGRRLARFDIAVFQVGQSPASPKLSIFFLFSLLLPLQRARPFSAYFHR